MDLVLKAFKIFSFEQVDTVILVYILYESSNENNLSRHSVKVYGIHALADFSAHLSIHF
jgi:hypothetical protein